MLVNTCKGWYKVPPDGDFNNEHYTRQSASTSICTTTTKSEIEIPYKDDLTTLTSTATQVLTKFNIYVADKVKTYKEEKPKFTMSNGIRFFMAKSLTTYANALETCELNKSQMVEVQNDNLHTGVKALLTAAKMSLGSSIWQPIMYAKGNFFLSYKPIPKILDSVSVTNNINNLHMESKCSIITLEPLELKTTSCILPATTICVANTQPSDITTLTLLQATLISSVDSFKGVIKQLTTEVHNLESTTAEKVRKKYNFLQKDHVEIIKGTALIKNEMILDYIPSFVQYIQSTTNQLANAALAIKSKQRKLLTLVCSCEENDHHTKANSVFQDKSVFNLKKTTNSIVIEAHEYSDCTTKDVIEIFPLVASTGIFGNFTFQDTKCVEVPYNCMNTSCPSELYTKNTCCQGIFNSTDDECSQTTNMINWWYKNDTSLVFSSKEEVNINSTCDKPVFATSGIITTTDECTVRSYLPFITNPFKGKFSFFSPGGSSTQTNSTQTINTNISDEQENQNSFFTFTLSEAEKKVLPWIGAFGSVATGILCIITIIFMVRRRRNTNEANEPATTLPLSETPAPKGILIKNRNTRRTRQMYRSSSDDSNEMMNSI